MKRSNIKLIERIQRKARESICRTKVAALGFNRDNVCIMARTNKPRFGRYGGGTHAERLIMAEAKKRGIVKILICRVSKTGNLLPIDPCTTCQNIADKLNITIETVPGRENV